MKHLRLWSLVAAASLWCTAAPHSAFACDDSAKGASAANASSKGAPECCAAATTTAAAAKGHCAKGASATTASTAAMDHCAKGASAAMATVSAAACAKGAMKAGANCPMHGIAMVSDAGTCNASGAHSDEDCAICFDELQCQEALRGLSARAQVVTLRNGAMVVYTADKEGDVRALQAAVARHHERVMTALAAGSGENLCGGCKQFRGAMASGKFIRELVNVKNGCQILLTSSDKDIVNRIHDMTGAQTAVRVKS